MIVVVVDGRKREEIEKHSLVQEVGCNCVTVAVRAPPKSNPLSWGNTCPTRVCNVNVLNQSHEKGSLVLHSTSSLNTGNGNGLVQYGCFLKQRPAAISACLATGMHLPMPTTPDVHLIFDQVQKKCL